MATHRAWTDYWPTFRAKQMKILAGWISQGESGSVVGMDGAGKSNLLGFLCYYPGALKPYLGDQADSVIPVAVDLNNLPAYNLATFYRLVLRSFYEIRDRFPPALQALMADLYLANRAERDPFVSQSALRELLLHFQERDQRVVLVFNQFDYFCEMGTPALFNTLRGLRNLFKQTLSYIAGLRYEIAYLPNPETLGELRTLLDRLVCWVGPMAEADARIVIERETRLAATPPPENAVERLLSLTGGYPTLLNMACRWWLAEGRRMPVAAWPEELLTQPSFRYRLGKIWDGLTQEEQLTLAEMQRRPAGGETGKNDVAQKHHRALERLAQRDLCRCQGDAWQITIELLAVYISRLERRRPHQRGRGELWLDKETGQLHQGDVSLQGLAPLERAILEFFITHTHRPGSLFTKTEILANAWPDETGYAVSNEALEQMISRLRKKIEPDPPRYRYIVTYRARRGRYEEGGYRFYPEGKHKDRA